MLHGNTQFSSLFPNFQVKQWVLIIKGPGKLRVLHLAEEQGARGYFEIEIR